MGAYTVAASSTFNGFQKPDLHYIMSRPAWWVEVTIGQWYYSKVLWVLMFIHMGFSQAICAADLFPGNAPPCWGVEPVRSSGVWPRKQLGYPDEVLPSQCGLDESCHICQCLCILALKIPLYKTSRPVIWNSKAHFKFLYGSWGNSSWAYAAKSFSTLVTKISHLWSALQRNCGALNLCRIYII